MTGDPRYTNPYDNEMSGCVSSSHYSSGLIALIPWMYIKMCGTDGLKESSMNAILNANYIKHHLKDIFKVKYTNDGYVAHECILDFSDFSKYNIKEKDIAKRLMD